MCSEYDTCQGERAGRRRDGNVAFAWWLDEVSAVIAIRITERLND